MNEMHFKVKKVSILTSSMGAVSFDGQIASGKAKLKGNRGVYE